MTGLQARERPESGVQQLTDQLDRNRTLARERVGVGFGHEITDGGRRALDGAQDSVNDRLRHGELAVGKELAREAREERVVRLAQFAGGQRVESGDQVGGCSSPCAGMLPGREKDETLLLKKREESHFVDRVRTIDVLDGEEGAGIEVGNEIARKIGGFNHAGAGDGRPCIREVRLARAGRTVEGGGLDRPRTEHIDERNGGRVGRRDDEILAAKLRRWFKGKRELRRQRSNRAAAENKGLEQKLAVCEPAHECEGGGDHGGGRHQHGLGVVQREHKQRERNVADLHDGRGLPDG